MKICFYTSDRPSVTNLLNIAYLIRQRPQHEYSFVCVASKSSSLPGLRQKLVDKYVRLRYNDGRFDFEDDLNTISQRLMPEIGAFQMSAYPTVHVGEVNDKASEDAFKSIQPDVIIQAGAGILKANVFSLSFVATINVHHGLAPEVRGVHSTFWCMLYGIRNLIGVTCHMVDAGLDTGAIIVKRTLQPADGSYIDVACRNYLMGRDVLTDSIDILEKGNLEIKKGETVTSYYFSNPDNFLYYGLKKRNFQPLLKIGGRKCTTRETYIVENG